jgi:tetratricopeptide (TPR) repeat protein
MNIFNRLSHNSGEPREEEKIHNLCARGKAFLKDGLKNFERGDYASAIDANREPIRVMADINTILQNNTGISNSTVKETKALKTAIVDQFTFYHDKGAQANCSRDYEKAANCFAVAASLESNTFIATFRLANTFLSSKNYIQARDVLNGIIAAAPGNSKAYREIGYSYTSQANYPKAIEYLNKAIDITLEDGTAHYFIAICYAAIGDVANGRIHGQKARTFGVEEIYQDTYKQNLSELGV